jgi:putative transposase
MKSSQYSDSRILAILKQAESGLPIPQRCREYDMSSVIFYKWRVKFRGMDASLMTRMKGLKMENRRLKKMYAEERLKYEVVQEAMAKKWRSRLCDERWLKSQSKPSRSVSSWSVVSLAPAKPANAIHQN